MLDYYICHSLLPETLFTLTSRQKENCCNCCWFRFQFRSAHVDFSANPHLFKVNNVKLRKRYKICSKLIIKAPENINDFVLPSLLLALKILYIFYCCFCCWLSTGIGEVGNWRSSGKNKLHEFYFYITYNKIIDFFSLI